MYKQCEQLDGWSVTPNVDDDAECRRRATTSGDAGFPFLTRSTFLSVETRARADSERRRARLSMYNTRVFFKGIRRRVRQRRQPTTPVDESPTMARSGTSGTASGSSASAMEFVRRTRPGFPAGLEVRNARARDSDFIRGLFVGRFRFVEATRLGRRSNVSVSVMAVTTV